MCWQGVVINNDLQALNESHVLVIDNLALSMYPRTRQKWSRSVFSVPSLLYSTDRIFGMERKVSYAEQAVDRGALAVAVTNGGEAIVLCVERPTEQDDTGSSEVWEVSYCSVHWITI